MLLKTNQTPQERRKYFTNLGLIAQLALIAAIVLGRLDTLNLDFIIGMLYGFSLVGNLAFLIVVGRYKLGGNDVR